MQWLTEEAVGVVVGEVRGGGGGRKEGDIPEMTNSLALGSNLKFFIFIALYREGEEGGRVRRREREGGRDGRRELGDREK